MNAARPLWTGLLAVGCLLLAGCLGSSTEPTPFRLSGSFTEDRTQADLDEFHALVEPYATDVRIMESFPEQFAIDGRDLARCDGLAALLASKDYIAHVGDCLAR